MQAITDAPPPNRVAFLDVPRDLKDDYCMGTFISKYLVEPFCSGLTMFKCLFENIVFPGLLLSFCEPIRYLFPGVGRHRQSRM